MLIYEEGTIQRPIYYVSRLIRDVETRYSKIEKIALALIISAQHLHPYFQAHIIAVLIDITLQQILSKLELSGCLIKWSVELSEFNLQYSVKA